MPKKYHKINYVLLLCLFLLSGCIKEFSKLSDAKIGLSLISMKDISPIVLRKNPTIVPAPLTQNLLCTNLVEMNLKSEGFPIYVDGNKPQSGDGSSWDEAVNSIVMGLKKAFDLRSELLRASGPHKDRPIYVLVAGGTYSFSREDAALKALNRHGLSVEESILRFVGIEGQVMSNIHVMGGYAFKDKCLENHVNKIANPNTQRETVLDGEGHSNHVILVSGEGTHQVEINGFTVRGGHARGIDASNPALDFYKKTGGGLAIRGKVHDIAINNVKFENNQSRYNGGCVAISENAQQIKFNNIQFSHCNAGENGGAVYVAGNARDITFDAVRARDCVASGQGNLPVIAGASEPLLENVGGVIRRPTGNGGVFYIAKENWNGEQNSVKGPEDVRLYHNPLRDPFQNNLEINFENNRAQAHGGAIALAGQGLKNIHIKSMYMKSNHAGDNGGAIAIFKTGTKTLLRGWQRKPENFPAPLIELANNRFESNTVTNNAAHTGGGGLALFDGVERIAVSNSLFLENQAPQHGGGIFMQGAVQLVTLNTVQSIRNSLLAAAGTEGAGIYMASLNLQEKTQRIKIENSLIEGHTTSGFGAGITAGMVSGLWINQRSVIAHNHSAGKGGGLYLWGSDHVSLNDSTFNDNQAADTGGALFVFGSHVQEHRDVEYRNNTALQDGGAFHIQQAMNENRTQYSSMPLVGLHCIENSAPRRGGCGFIELSPATWIAGGRYERNGLANPQKGINHATETGGALYYVSDSLLHGTDLNAEFFVASAQFSENQALNAGGALYTEHAFDVQIRRTEFSQNQTIGNNGAGSVGGAIYCDFSQYNQAQLLRHHGGGQIQLVGDTKFLRNQAVGSGGALFAQDLHSFTISGNGGRLDGNRTLQGNGGALSLTFNNGMNTILDLRSSDGEFSQNQATAVGATGGAIEIVEAPRRVDLQGVFRSNLANNGGGALHISGPRAIQNIRFNFPTFEQNSTEQNNGGAILIDPTVAIINPFTVSAHFIANRALNGVGGAIAFMSQLPQLFPFRIDGALLESNQAQNDAIFHIAHMPPAGLEILSSGIKYHQKTTPGCGGAFDFSGVNLGYVLIANTSIYHNKTVNGNGGALCFGTINGPVTITNTLNQFDAGIVQRVYRAALMRQVGSASNLSLWQVRRVIGNTANGHGGAFYFQQINGVLTVSNQLWLANQTTNGSGGALYVENLGRKAWFKSNLLAYNKAQENGGAVALPNMHGQSVLIEQRDKLAPVEGSDEALDPNWRTKPKFPVEYLNAPADRLNFANEVFNVADAYRKDDVQALLSLDALNGTDQQQTKRGMFLVEENSADGSGGAFFIDGAGRIMVNKIPFANNKAGFGGTIAAVNLNNVFSIKDSMIYGGKASGNAGGISVSGSANAGARRALIIENSSFQECEAGSVAIPQAQGAAGVFLENMNELIVRQSNFFANRVLQAQPGSSWAAAMSFLSRTTDPLPATNPAYVVHSDVHHPLLDLTRHSPVQMAGPIKLEDNKVIGALGPTTTSTISIPNAVRTMHYFVYTQGAFSVSGNVPQGAGNAPLQVVLGH